MLNSMGGMSKITYIALRHIDQSPFRIFSSANVKNSNMTDRQKEKFDNSMMKLNGNQSNSAITEILKRSA